MELPGSQGSGKEKKVMQRWSQAIFFVCLFVFRKKQKLSSQLNSSENIPSSCHFYFLRFLLKLNTLSRPKR